MPERYDCCTHYRTDTYSKGYVMLKCLPVKICDNCGEVQDDNWSWWQRALSTVLMPFWSGKVTITKIVGDMGKATVYGE